MRISSNDSSNLLSIPRLNRFRRLTLFRAYNNYTGAYNAYLKAYFIKVIDIIVDNTVLSLNVCYKLKPILNNLRIFI